MIKPDVILSAGHYSASKGFCIDGLCEYPLTKEWAEEIGVALPHNRVVAFAPDADLKTKIALINKSAPRLAVEIHFNASVAAASGSETLHSASKASIYAATYVQARLGKLVLPDRKTKVGYYQGDPKKGMLPFLKDTICPAIIVEVCFLKDYLGSVAAIKDRVVKQIAAGIEDFLKLNDPANGSIK